MGRRALPQRIRRSVQRQATHLLETGSRFQRFDQLRQRHFWSDYFFTPDANGYIQSGGYKTFLTPAGQVGQGWPVALTDLETNWKSANRVPDNQNFEVLELGVSIQAPPTDFNDEQVEPIFVNGPPTPRECNAFAQNMILAIQYLTNEVPLGFISDFAQASGPTMGSYEASTAAANPAVENPTWAELGAATPQSRRVLTNGFAGPGLRRRFKVPILLQHGETFSFNLLVPRTFNVCSQANAAKAAYVLRVDFWATESFVEKS